MNIVYQFYNEISLAFSNYDTDFNQGLIIIYVPDDNKPFKPVCEKLEAQIRKIAETLDERDIEVVVEIRRTVESKQIVLEKSDGSAV